MYRAMALLSLAALLLPMAAPGGAEREAEQSQQEQLAAAFAYAVQQRDGPAQADCLTPQLRSQALYYLRVIRRSEVMGVSTPWVESYCGSVAADGRCARLVFTLAASSGTCGVYPVELELVRLEDGRWRIGELLFPKELEPYMVLPPRRQ